MNKSLLIILIGIALAVGFYFLETNKEKLGVTSDTSTTTDSSSTEKKAEAPSFAITPVNHATAVVKWDNTVIYLDPVGGSEAFTFTSIPPADIILITDIHSDHYSPETLRAILNDAELIAPQAVVDMMPDELADQATVLANDQTIEVANFKITGVPMYNLPETSDSPHPKGRGNGYILERDGYRMYVAGDTSATPEMKAQKDIYMAFVPMNLPYTMSVEEAAEGVLAFKPKTVYPYHYRGQEGLADTNKFKELVEAGSDDIRVILMDWYHADPDPAN